MGIRRSLPALVAIYLFDGFVVQLPMISFFAGSVMVLLGVVEVVRGEFVRRGVLRIAAWFVLDVAVWGTIRLNNHVALVRAERIIAALDRYRAEHGQYPMYLEQLVPSYLPSIPLARYTLLFPAFRYHTVDGETGALAFWTSPPFARMSYVLSTKKWHYVD